MNGVHHCHDVSAAAPLPHRRAKSDGNGWRSAAVATANPHTVSSSTTVKGAARPARRTACIALIAG